MKKVAVFLLALLPGLANAGLTKDEVEACVGAESFAETVLDRKQAGVSKSALYSAISGVDNNSLGFLIIDNIFDGFSPQDVFNFCVNASKED